MLSLTLKDGTPAAPHEAAYAAAVEEYDALVATLAQANGGSRAWWYGWLSCRDIYNTRMLDHLAAITATAGGSGVVPCADGAVAAEIATRARANRTLVSRSPAATLTWAVRSWYAPLTNARRLAAELAWQLRWWRTTRRSRPQDMSGADVILVTMLHEATPGLRTAPYVDTYFGDLPALLQAKGLKPTVIGQPVGPAATMADAIARVRGIPVHTLFGFVRPFDIAAAFTTAVFARLRVPRTGPLASRPLRRLVRREHSRSRPYIARGLLLERALRRALTLAPNARIIHMCENNQWERACVLAARSFSPPRAVDGYMHNPILPDNTKLRSSREEWTTRPDPDRIITTGEGARAALLSLGTYPPKRVVAGCALRLAYDPAAALRSHDARPIRTILVLLSGLPSMAVMLSWLDEAARGVPDVRILLRGHPNRPVEDLAALAGVDVGPGHRLEKSPDGTLEAALDAADAVIYASSAAAFAAAWRGLPLLHFKGGALGNADPFFMQPDLRHVLISPADLAAAISALNARAPTERKRHATALAAYARACMTPPDDASLAVFMCSASSPAGSMA